MMDNLWKIANRAAYLHRRNYYLKPKVERERDEVCRHTFVNIPQGPLSDCYDVKCRKCHWVKGIMASHTSKGHKNLKGTQNLKKREVVEQRGRCKIG